MLLIGLFAAAYRPVERVSDFERKLSNIVTTFQAEIMDVDECDRQMRAAATLEADISDALRMEDEYDPEEMIHLRQLQKETAAVEAYIDVVGNVGNHFMKIDDLAFANRRIGGSIARVISGKYCVDIITVTIGDYVAYFGENNSTSNFTVNYKWKSNSGMQSGNGTMGILKSNVRHFCDNREYPTQKGKTIMGISCVEF